MSEAPDTPEMKAVAAFLAASFDSKLDGKRMREAMVWSLGSAAVQAAQPGSVGETVTDAVCDALIQAWTLGQYYHGYNDRDDQLGAFKAQETHTKFVALLDKTRAMLAAAPTEAKPAQDAVDAEQIKKALNQAFVMGQSYWHDADSESYAANKRSDVTRQKFNEMRDELCAAISAKKGGA